MLLRASPGAHHCSRAYQKRKRRPLQRPPLPATKEICRTVTDNSDAPEKRKGHDGGVFGVARTIWNHPMFAGEPFSKREAWLWLVSSAVWKPTKIEIGEIEVHLERGQMAHSERFIAKKWGWPKTNVRRFLRLLESAAMIIKKVPAKREVDHPSPKSGPQSGPPRMLITICNYDKDQTVWRQSGPLFGPQENENRTKEELLNLKKREPLQEVGLWMDDTQSCRGSHEGKTDFGFQVIARERSRIEGLS